MAGDYPQPGITSNGTSISHAVCNTCFAYPCRCFSTNWWQWQQVPAVMWPAVDYDTLADKIVEKLIAAIDPKRAKAKLDLIDRLKRAVEALEK